MDSASQQNKGRERLGRLDVKACQNDVFLGCGNEKMSGKKRKAILYTNSSFLLFLCWLVFQVPDVLTRKADPSHAPRISG